MKLGVFTALFAGLTLDQVIDKVTAAGLDAVEIGTGAYPGAAHIDVDDLLSSKARAKAYRTKLADAGLTISALSCHGNPIHPDKAMAKDHDEVFRKTVRVAELLGVGVVNTFSGCPGDSDASKAPNWITCAWPPDFLKTLDWQWEKKVIPYWTRAGKFAKDHGVRVALESHPGFVVYNVETALKLRSAVGKQIGVNFDPSHLFWQGVDVPAAIHALGEAIFHFHAKDVALDRNNVRLERRDRRQVVHADDRAVMAVPDRRLGPWRHRVGRDHERPAPDRLRPRGQHRARRRTRVGRRRLCQRRQVPAAADPQGAARRSLVGVAHPSSRSGGEQ